MNKRNWRTTIAGYILAAGLFAQSNGIKIGNLGATNFTDLAVVVSAMMLGHQAKDKQNQ